MRERRRSGRLVLPAARPPADRALLGPNTGSGHHSDLWRSGEWTLLLLNDDRGQAADPGAPRLAFGD